MGSNPISSGRTGGRERNYIAPLGGVGIDDIVMILLDFLILGIDDIVLKKRM